MIPGVFKSARYENLVSVHFTYGQTWDNLSAGFGKKVTGKKRSPTLNSPVITHATSLIVLRAGSSPIVKFCTHFMEPRVFITLRVFSRVLIKGLSDLRLQSPHSKEMHRYQLFGRWGPGQYPFYSYTSVINSLIKPNIDERVCCSKGGRPAQNMRKAVSKPTSAIQH
jgi:hypothetical protein